MLSIHVQLPPKPQVEAAIFSNKATEVRTKSRAKVLRQLVHFPAPKRYHISQTVPGCYAAELLDGNRPSLCILTPSFGQLSRAILLQSFEGPPLLHTHSCIKAFHSFSDMDHDEIEQTHKRTLRDWQQRLSKYNTAGIKNLAFKYRNGKECECVEMKNGSFNWCFKVVFSDDVAWAVRFPTAGMAIYPEEKLRREVAVLRFRKEKTRVPVPEVIAFGMAVDNHDPGMGPFLITEWIEGVPLSSVMEELPRPEWGPILRRDIGDETLYTIYKWQRFFWNRQYTTLIKLGHRVWWKS
jgi:hypothetical protein